MALAKSKKKKNKAGKTTRILIEIFLIDIERYHKVVESLSKGLTFDLHKKFENFGKTKGYLLF